MSKRVDLRIDVGSDYDKFFRLLDYGCNPMDLNGYTARMQVRPYVRSEKILDTLTTENGRLSTDKYGLLHVSFPAEVTTEYKFDQGVFDIEIIDPSGRVLRVAQGRLYLNQEVTR